MRLKNGQPGQQFTVNRQRATERTLLIYPGLSHLPWELFNVDSLFGERMEKRMCIITRWRYIKGEKKDRTAHIGESNWIISKLGYLGLYISIFGQTKPVLSLSLVSPFLPRLCSNSGMSLEALAPWFGSKNVSHVWWQIWWSTTTNSMEQNSTKPHVNGNFRT